MRRNALIVFVLVIVMVSACGDRAEPQPTPLADEPFASVVSVTGEVVPAEWATVSAQAGGTAMEVLVEPGDVVAAGDLLVQLEAADAELAVRRAQVALEAARHQLALIESRPRPEEVAVAEIEEVLAGIE